MKTFLRLVAVGLMTVTVSAFLPSSVASATTTNNCGLLGVKCTGEVVNGIVNLVVEKTLGEKTVVDVVFDLKANLEGEKDETVALVLHLIEASIPNLLNQIATLLLGGKSVAEIAFELKVNIEGLLKEVLQGGLTLPISVCREKKDAWGHKYEECKTVTVTIAPVK